MGERLIETIRTLSNEYSQTQVARWAGVTPSVVHRIIRQGPTARVDAANKVKLLTLTQTPEVTPVGYTRRMRALMWLGYSAPRIAAEAGLDKETVKKCLQRPPSVVKVESRRKIHQAYERLSLSLPTADDRFERAQITRAQGTARRKGWLPPLAWDNIDDPNERPSHNVREHNTPATLQQRIDMAAVWRLVDDGVRVRQLTSAEAREAYQILAARGLTGREIERRYGINATRYWEVA